MNQIVTEYLLYLLKILLMTLGTLIACGFAVRLCAMLFSNLIGYKSITFFNITAAIGTPIHELGHAAMCILFAHRITDICLWSPSAENGVYGYVQHSYNRKNVWARLGNLFIGFGPIFSGLGVTILALWLCFPDQWAGYLSATRGLAITAIEPKEIFDGVLSLITSMPQAFQTNWILAVVGLIVILPISLHISLSGADIKGSASAVPLFVLLAALFALVTMWIGFDQKVVSGLYLFNLRVLSLFAVVLAFSVIWVLIGVLTRLVRWVISLV